MDELKQRYAKLTEREQWLVKIIGVLFIITLLYSMLWSPLVTAVDKGERSLKTQKNLLQTMQKNSQRVRQLKASGSSNTKVNGTLAQVINRTARSLSVPISRTQPQAQGEELIVWVDEAPFDSVLAWFQTLETSGVRILDADIVETNKPGLIKVRRLQVGKS